MFRFLFGKLKNQKLWQKLLLIYLGISIVPLSGLSIYNAYNTTELMRQQVSTRLSDITKTLAADIEKRIGLIDGVVEQYIYSDAFLQTLSLCKQENSSQRITETMQSIQENLSPLFEEKPAVRFLSPSGGDQSDYARCTALFAKNRYRHITCNENTVSIYYQTYNFYQNQAKTGLVEIRLSSPSFIGKIQPSGIDQYIFIIQNNQGNTLYLHANTVNDYGSVVLNIMNRTAKKTIKIHDESFLFEPFYINSAEWMLCFLVPQTILYRNFSKTVSSSIILCVLCLVIVSIFSVLSSVNISRRINNIGSEMSLIGDGQLEMPFDVDESGDEIGQLSMLFHQMMERINSLVIEQYKSEIKLHEEQLKILQNQINPHFLYNCMDTINWRCILNNDTKTSAFANNLADFYRTCLNKGHTRIMLQDELKNIRSYIYLQLDMHDDSFRYTEEINPEINYYEGINLMLQPLVENALEHGLELSKQQDNLLKIHADFGDETHKTIRISIFNSGTPIDPVIASEVMQGQRGYGVTNVNNRIKLYFGQEYGITIVPQQDGTCCTVTIPAKRWEQDET